MIKVINGNGSETCYSDAETALANGVAQGVIDAAIEKQAWQAIKRQRELLLIEADHLVNKAVDFGVDSALFRAYRQALRDIPQTYLNAGDVVWPTKPSLPSA